MVVLLAKPEGNSSDLSFSRRVVAEVEALLAKQDLKRYGPNFKIQLTGTYKKKVDQQAQISRDLSSASTVALVLLLGYLLFHFRQPVAVLLNLGPVLVSLVWTYGIVGAVYGSVNLLTGFLAAILGGLGIEHGIHLLGRYESLRAKGESSEQATRDAFTHTGGAALISALVAALTFLSLAISEFRAFREFGVIAAMGMLTVIAAYVLVLPALIALGGAPGLEAVVPGGGRAALPPGGVAAEPPLPAGRGGGHGGDAAGPVRQRHEQPLQLRLRRAGRQQPALVRVRPQHQQGAGLFADAGGGADPRRPQRAGGGGRAANSARSERGSATTLDFVAALDDLVPQQQPEKQQVLTSIGEVLAKVKRDGLDEKTRGRFDDLKKMVAAKPFDRGDLPPGVRRQFLGIDEGRKRLRAGVPGHQPGGRGQGARVRQGGALAGSRATASGCRRRARRWSWRTSSTW